MKTSKMIEKELIKKCKKLREGIDYLTNKLKNEKNSIKRIEIKNDIKTLQKCLNNI